jgi:pimeloyl-ACP methyl ester carboxylesterase
MCARLANFWVPHPPQPQLPLFIYLPGLDGAGRLLQVQLAQLRQSYDVRCLVMPADDATGWLALAQGVVAWVQQVQAEQPNRPITLCGESFGGCLAMQVVALAPHCFRQLVLVNPASSFSRRPWLALGSQLSRWLPEGVHQFAVVNFLPFLAAFERVALPDRQALEQAVRSLPAQTSAWRIELLSQFQTPIAALEQFVQPVLIMASGRDQLLPSLAEAYRLKGIFPRAQVVELPHSGHACLLEMAVNLHDLLLTYAGEPTRVSKIKPDARPMA